MSVFNNVKGLHPKRNKFTADTYRNDFTAALGMNIPCFWAEVPPATRYKVSAAALVRLQALIAPVMDNIDYYVHFWKIPYRLLEDDRFTKFISGEIEAQDYDALFATPAELARQVNLQLGNLSFKDSDARIAFYNNIFGNGSILDFLGYDLSLFPTLTYDSEDDLFVLVDGNDTTTLNWRGLIAYFMIHLNWYMNENVPYYNTFVEDVEKLIKEQSISILAKLLMYSQDLNRDFPLMLPHGWEKDYFTSALPNVQNGSPVTLSLAGSAPVSVPAQTAIINPVQSPVQLDYLQFGFKNYGVVTTDGETIQTQGLLNEKGQLVADAEGNPINQILGRLEGNTSDSSLQASADLSEASAITINELRFANALQVFKERQLRFGRRRLEYYKGFFDVEPEDLRLQVPKYLGGGRIPINIADIEQTSQTSGSSALGHLAGKATAVAGGFAGFSTFCSEETFIIGIAFAMPHITYAQQLSRFKMKTNDIYDYFNPSFEHLGEQAIKNIEIYAGSVTPDGDFGYTPRYTEYRFHSNEMHGEFKDSLAFWSLGRIFDSQPALNADFIYMQPAVFNRIFAVSNQPSMIVSMLFHTKAIKPVSKYGTPMLLA